jgi:hypothetical protein
MPYKVVNKFKIHVDLTGIFDEFTLIFIYNCYFSCFVVAEYLDLPVFTQQTVITAQPGPGMQFGKTASI